MRILLLAEGDPETLDSWSGSSQAVLRKLRERGHEVTGRDVSEGGLARLSGMAASWAPRRTRWAARYHFGPIGFHARTSRAAGVVRSASPLPDAVLQIGATFDGIRALTGPGYLYCDGNVRTAARNAPYGQVAALTPREQDRMARREAGVYARASAIFTMSEYLRRSFIEDFQVLPHRVVTVYAGANLDLDKVIPRPAVLTGPPTILFVGRQWEPKGGPELLAAFREVRKEFPEARLRIVGCSPALGDEPGVEILGSISKATPDGEQRLSEVYRSADVFCMPSHFDAFGIVFVEAMLHGLACIGADRCAMPEIIEPGVTGWVAPAGDVPALRDRLLGALRDRAALAAMGRLGVVRARRLFTWDAVADRMLDAMTPSRK